jgi:hypothetical protein
MGRPSRFGREVRCLPKRGLAVSSCSRARQSASYAVIKRNLLRVAKRKGTRTSSNTPASKKVTYASKLTVTGPLTRGDRNWPRNKAVVKPPKTVPRTASGASFASQTYRFGTSSPRSDQTNIQRNGIAGLR